MRVLKKRKNEKRAGFLAFLLLSAWLGGCEQWGGRLPESVLAQVNQDRITIEEFEKEMKDGIVEPGSQRKGEDLEALKRAYLDQVIDRKILVQEARRLGIGVSSEELNQAIAEVRRDYNQKEFGERLGLKGTNLEEWKGRLEEKLLAEKMVRSALQYPGEISEQEALQYYERHRASFTLAKRVRVQQIVVADGEEAIQILKRLRKGEKFEKLAQEKSLGPEKVSGGDLGTFSQGEKPPEFDPVFALEVGSISEVTKSPYGYHIFKVKEKMEAREIPFEEARPRILQELKKKKEQEEYQRWFKELRKKAKVIINLKRFRS